ARTEHGGAARPSAELEQRPGVKRDEMPLRAREADVLLTESVHNQLRVEASVDRDPNLLPLRRLHEEAEDAAPVDQQRCVPGAHLVTVLIGREPASAEDPLRA